MTLYLKEKVIKSLKNMNLEDCMGKERLTKH